MKTLEEYKMEVAKAILLHAPELENSGIQCPSCAEELAWAERSLFSRVPQMRRLLCPGCGFSEVVAVLEPVTA